MQIYTDRLMIVPITDEEMQQLIDQEEDQEMKQAYTEMLDGCKKDPQNRIWSAVWDICKRDNIDIVIGDLSFKGLGPDGMVEIGYGIKEEYWNQGYTTEAVIAMSKWAMEQLGVNRVEAETEENNIASQKVLKKAGYVPTGKMGEEGPRFYYISKQ